MVKCQICDNDIWSGFGSQSRRAQEMARICTNCRTTRCNNCTLGYFCKKCIEEIPDPDLYKEVYELGESSKSLNAIVPALTCLMIFTGGLALKLGPAFLIMPGLVILILIFIAIPASSTISKQKKLMKLHGYQKVHRKFIKPGINDSPEAILKHSNTRPKPSVQGPVKPSPLSFITDEELTIKFEKLKGENLSESQIIGALTNWAWEIALNKGITINHGEIGAKIKSLDLT